MNENDFPTYRPLTRLELREKYGGIPQGRSAPRISLDEVPIELHSLIPLAEKWGIREGAWVPQDILHDLPKEEIEHLVRTLSQVFDGWGDDDPLWDWLVEMGQSEEGFNDACVAFDELFTTYEKAEWLLRQLNEEADKLGRDD